MKNKKTIPTYLYGTGFIIFMLYLAAYLTSCSTYKGVDVTNEDAYFKSLHKHYGKTESARTARVPIILFTTNTTK